jgi:Uma2 family endonuclease
MADLARKYEGNYSYNDYLAINDGNRYEVIDGELYMMSSPSFVHQRIVGEIHGQLYNKLLGKSCTPIVSPMDVRLFYEEDGSDTTIVQPDVFVVCDKGKIGKNSINGAPDFVIEVLSPSNSLFEMSMKGSMYELSGVKEYWIIDYEGKEVLKYILVNGRFNGEKIILSGVCSVSVLSIDIDLDRLINIIGV